MKGMFFRFSCLFAEFLQIYGETERRMLFSVETDVFFAFYLNIRKICDIIIRNECIRAVFSGCSVSRSARK